MLKKCGDSRKGCNVPDGKTLYLLNHRTGSLLPSNKTTDMKPKHLCPILLLCATAVGFLSCDKNDEPLSLLYVENHTVDLYYPSAEGGTISITGGDGNYRAESDDPSIVTVEMPWRNTIRLTPLQRGNTTVTIHDGAGKTYQLEVRIDYRRNILTIYGVEATVTGNGLTEQERETIRTEALSTIPVGTGGGYELVYTGEDGYSGDMILYPTKIGEQGTEGTFREESTPPNTFIYTFRFEGEIRRFRIGETDSHSSSTVSTALIEEITERFSERYPAVEQVVTCQRLY